MDDNHHLWAVLYSSPARCELRPCNSEESAKSFADRFSVEGYSDFEWCQVIAYRPVFEAIRRPEGVPYDFS